VQLDEERQVIDARTKIASAEGQRELLLSQRRPLERERDTAFASAKVAKEAAVLLQQTASASRTQLQTLIQPLMSEALHQLLGGEAGFRLQFGQVAGKVTAKLITINDKGLEVEGVEGFGGGVADLESMILLLIFIARLGLPKIVFLDEPFRHIHGREALETISDFLRVVTDRLGYQLFVVTGDEDVSSASADTIFQVNNGPKGSVVQRVR